MFVSEVNQVSFYRMSGFCGSPFDGYITYSMFVLNCECIQSIAQLASESVYECSGFRVKQRCWETLGFCKYLVVIEGRVKCKLAGGVLHN
jgi:hypothetical protein